MAFPTTSVLDAFTRANLGNLGANWTNDTIGQGSDHFSITSNAAENSIGPYAEAYYNVATYGPDSEVYVTVAQLANGSTPSFGLMIRCQSPGSAACDGYRLQIAGSTWDLLEVTNGTEGASMDTATQAVSAGNKVGLEMIGTALKAYYHNGTSWSEILSTTDGTITGAGNIGMWGYAGIGASLNHRFDDFAGGTVVGGGTDYTGNVPGAAAGSASGPTPGVNARPFINISVS